ncbi:MAG: ATP-dependent Clp protease ATP-binding subunit [Myxococcales bacterium]|nr:ATP-dependent Clp protease ATP-binding subunit [Myxococcales bacterium]
MAQARARDDVDDDERPLQIWRTRARDLASARKERLTSVHVLAALAQHPGAAFELLAQRKLGVARIFAHASAATDRAEESLATLFNTARDVARRAATPGVTMVVGPLHLLLALVGGRRYAAFATLEAAGIDVVNLRSAATRLALGVTAPIRSRTSTSEASKPSLPARTKACAAEPAPPEPNPRDRRPEANPRDRRPPAVPRDRPSARAVEVTWIPGPSARQDGVPLRRTSESPPQVNRACEAITTLDDAAERCTSGRAAMLAAEAPARTAEDVRRRTVRTTRLRVDAVAAHPAATAGVELSLDLDARDFPLLSRMGRNLTAAAVRGELEPVLGRELELERALDVLAKRHANNPLFVGEAGVGKTSVARAVAMRFAAEPERRLLIEIAVTELVSGTGARGQLVERIAELRAELGRANKRVVLFIDDIHELLGGAADEALGELKSALAAGELPIVAATTPEHYRKVMETDPALARRFAVIELEPPTESDAVVQVGAVCERLGAHHDVRFAKDAIESAVAWAARYLAGRALPDKAVGVLDLAAARARRASGAGDAKSSGARREPMLVRREDVAAVLASAAAVPLERLLETDGERMLRLDELLGERVVGHRGPSARIAAVLRRNAAGLRGSRPIGSFLLLGPTGVGKTEMAKALAEILFHSREAMTRLDMSEYAEAHAVARLVGAPPGYVGHEAGGQLTEAVRKRPYQVLLLDEIEKAHRDVLLAFLQVFDEGRLTDGRGRTVDFTNAVIVLTSNLGAVEMRAAQTERRVGFAVAPPSVDSARLEDAAVTAARRTLPAELYNRLDEVLFFAPLGREEVRAITVKLLDQLVLTLRARDVTLRYDQSVPEHLLAEGGYDPELGARPMRRAIVRLLEAPLADLLLSGKLVAGGSAQVKVEDGQLRIDPHAPPARAPAR